MSLSVQLAPQEILLSFSLFQSHSHLHMPCGVLIQGNRNNEKENIPCGTLYFWSRQNQKLFQSLAKNKYLLNSMHLISCFHSFPKPSDRLVFLVLIASNIIFNSYLYMQISLLMYLKNDLFHLTFLSELYYDTNTTSSFCYSLPSLLYNVLIIW